MTATRTRVVRKNSTAKATTTRVAAKKAAAPKIADEKVSARNTLSGVAFEKTLTGAALKKQYGATIQQPLIDPLFSGGKTWKIDLLLTAPDLTGTVASPDKIGVSVKFQEVSGSADEKIPAEILRLAGLVSNGTISRAYLVLGGSGSKNFAHYLAGTTNVPGQDLIEIVDEKAFRRLVASRSL